MGMIYPSVPVIAYHSLGVSEMVELKFVARKDSCYVIKNRKARVLQRLVCGKVENN